MIRTLLYDPQSGVTKAGGKELIDEWNTSDQSTIWCDIEGESDASDRALLTQFQLHPLAIQDALRVRHPPKLEQFNDIMFVLLRGLDADSNKGIDTNTIQLSLFFQSRFLVTRHAKPSASANWLFDQAKTDFSLIEAGTNALAIQLSNRLARRYVEILLELETRLDEIEEEMFRSPDDKLLVELTRYKSRLRKLTRTASYHKDVARGLRSADAALLGEHLNHELVDLYEQIERTQTLANMYYQICTDLTDGYLGMSSHRLNRVMQLLTIITVIFVPLTFMAGIYGMNFQNMPELSSQNGYFVLVGLMLVVAVLQIIYFRRKRWL
jgi:magnesium transporter